MIISKTFDSLIRITDLKTRSSREDYWYAFAGWTLTGLFLAIVSVVALNAFNHEEVITAIAVIGNFSFYLTAFIAMFALCIRRLHDIGLSGLIFLISFTGIGNIALFAMMCIESNPETNKWGVCAKNI